MPRPDPAVIELARLTHQLCLFIEAFTDAAKWEIRSPAADHARTTLLPPLLAAAAALAAELDPPAPTPAPAQPPVPTISEQLAAVEARDAAARRRLFRQLREA